MKRPPVNIFIFLYKQKKSSTNLSGIVKYEKDDDVFEYAEVPV